MRDFTYIGGYRFLISNVYRSKRFDIDKLDINYVDSERPDFVRGYRIVDHNESETYTVHGSDADDLSYSLCFIHNSTQEYVPDQFDHYLTKAIEKKNYLAHEILGEEIKTEEAVH